MRIDSLDGLRALLALWVVFAHLAPIVGLRVPTVANPAVAVDLFMVLSGFLIATTYESMQRAHHDWRAPAFFWIRRIMRIWPLYVFLLTLVWIFYVPLQEYRDIAAAALTTGRVQEGVMATTPGKTGFSLVDAAWHYSMLFGLVDHQATSTPLPDWSLSLEFQFYLLFPLIAVAYRHRPFFTCIGAAVLFYVSPALLGNYIDPGQFAHFRQPALLTYRLNFFLVGCIAYYMSQASEQQAQHRNHLIALLLCMSVAGVRSAFGIIFVVYLITQPVSPIGKLLGSKPFAWMGRISFSMYLCHMPLLRLVLAGLVTQGWFLAMSPWSRYAVALAALLPLVLLCSHLLYKFIETPGNKLAHRWTSKSKPKPTAVAATPVGLDAGLQARS